MELPAAPLNYLAWSGQTIDQMASPRGNKNWIDWWRLSQLFRSVAPDDGSQRSRIRFMERSTVLPVKAVYFLVLIFYLYFGEWSPVDAPRRHWPVFGPGVWS